MVAIIVNGLFAQDDQTGLFFVNQRLEQFGNSQWLQFQIGRCFDQDTAIGANGHGRAQCFLALCHAARHCDDFCGNALLFQAHSFFHCDLVKGVHAHFDVGDVYAGTVRFDAHFDVVVDNPFNGNKNFHESSPLISKLKRLNRLITLTLRKRQLCINFAFG